MRLLFIYFYEDFGTFEKGSIIHLSKKYKFTLDKEKSTQNEFYFNKEENPNFIEHFYSKNIDIGVLIGENGTGKSVLLNSIRDKSNEYSICVYEEENRFYCFLNQKHIFIDNLQITKKELNYIYYTSLIDAFDNDINDKYNISNRAFLKRHDGKNLDIKLSLIENDDIQKYFKMEKKTNYDVEIKRLRINYNVKFFSQLKEKIFQKEFDNIYPIFIDNIKNKIKFIDVNLFSTEEEIYYNNIFRVIANNIKDEDLLEHIRKNRDFYLVNNFEFLNKTNQIINRKINQQLDDGFNEQLKQINLYFENSRVKNSFSNFVEEDIYIFKFLEKIDNDKIYYNEDIEFIFRLFKDMFLKYLHMNNIYEFLDKKISHYVEGNELYQNLIEYELYDEFVDFIFKKNKNKHKTLIKFLKFKYKNMFFEKYIEKNYNSDYKMTINNLENLKYLKLRLDLQYSQYEILNKIDNNTKIRIISYLKKKDITEIYFKIENVNTKKLLLILYLEDNYSYEVLLPKMNLINKFVKILELNDEIINDKNIFDNLEKDMNLNKKVVLNITNENIVNVNADFFVFYEKLIKYELKPFTYELHPSLSSGQKAILFIFARINDAIQNVKIEKTNENILILLDEADLKLHLEWQRQFLYDLIEFLNSYPNNKFYILYATHSPMILSDITNDRVVFLKKRDDNPSFSEDKQDFTKSTFGANIYDIYSDSFFVDDFMGKFAQNKINEVIKIIEKNKKIPNKKASNLLKVIKNIGEPLLRNKLEDEIKSLFEIDDDISKIVKNLKKKNYDEIKKELDKYSQDKQKEILEELFGNQND